MVSLSSASLKPRATAAGLHTPGRLTATAASATDEAEVAGAAVPRMAHAPVNARANLSERLPRRDENIDISAPSFLVGAANSEEFCHSIEELPRVAQVFGVRSGISFGE